jgi:hypothetical protein
LKGKQYMTRQEFEAAIKPTPEHPIPIDTQKAISAMMLERDLWQERAREAEATLNDFKERAMRNDNRPDAKRPIHHRF